MTLSPDKSREASNQYSFGCMVVGLEMLYRTCLDRVYAHMSGDDVPPDCAKAMNCGGCPAKKKREQELQGGRALYYKAGSSFTVVNSGARTINPLGWGPPKRPTPGLQRMMARRDRGMDDHLAGYGWDAHDGFRVIEGVPRRPKKPKNPDDLSDLLTAGPDYAAVINKVAKKSADEHEDIPVADEPTPEPEQEPSTPTPSSEEERLEESLDELLPPDDGVDTVEGGSW